MDQQQILAWIEQDPLRMRALHEAQKLGLDDWCLAAGFVRNLVWDRLHHYRHNSPLNDIDLVYFNPHDLSPETDRNYEYQLAERAPDLPWSVKNQARMHLKYGRPPYTSSSDAISYWVEIETAVGVRLKENNQLQLVAPLGIESLFAFTISPNPKHGVAGVLQQRARDKQWTKRWPKLTIKL